MKFNIATGISRFDTKWRNKQATWERLIEIISETKYTAETVAEYLAAKPDVQDQIKDVGGFVGGHVLGGRRLKDSVSSRQILTLDADAAEVNFWAKFCTMYDCTAAIYSTHKHTPEKPRYRLIIPLSREVFKDEYTAICRRIAGNLGIEQFDHTGYQFHRLMYWPSTSKDGEFISDHQGGLLLDPDEVLATYYNWQDVSEWPIGLRENKALTRDAKYQGDPEEKPGLIGAFNRTYPISTAIDMFLADIYEPSHIDTRYTFTEGSTAAGVITYDDKFSYSHHSTDPTCNILCNSFDLVRLHKYHLLDDNIDEKTPVNKKPSYVAMCEFASADSGVKHELGEARLQKARDMFEHIAATSRAIVKTVEGDEQNPVNDDTDDTVDAEEFHYDATNTEWLKEMDVDRKGNYLATINNMAVILEHDPAFAENIYYDEFEQCGFFKRDLPWRKVVKCNKREITDKDIANIENYIEKVYQISAGGSKLLKGLYVVFEKHSMHPIKKYLTNLRWDGVKRVDELLVKYLGAGDTSYTRAVTRKFMVAAVARVHEPGVKYDTILTLIGKEGQGKSHLFDKLGGKWFSDSFSFHMLQSKEAYEQIQGVWLVEISELSGISKMDVNKVKGFVAARNDRYRAAYGRTTESRPRQCVFVAGSNKWDVLRSQDGNRRFWPVVTFVVIPTATPFDLTKNDIDQLWAEAVELYKGGEKLYLDKELEKIAYKVQEKHTEENPWVSVFKSYLSKVIPVNWYDMMHHDKVDFLRNYDTNKHTKEVEQRTKVTPHELWEVALMKKEMIDIHGLKQVREAMDKINNWQKVEGYTRFGNYYPRHKGSYEKVSEPAEVEDINELIASLL